MSLLSALRDSPVTFARPLGWALLAGSSRAVGCAFTATAPLDLPLVLSGEGCVPRPEAAAAARFARLVRELLIAAAGDDSSELDALVLRRWRRSKRDASSG
jgi:hypothetical protein